MDGPLSGNALFSGVAPAALVRVLPAFRVTTVPRGTVLYERGLPARHVFLVVSGSVAIVQSTAGVENDTRAAGRRRIHRRARLARAGNRACVDGAVLRREPDCVCERRCRVRGDRIVAGDRGMNVARGVHRRVRDAALAIDRRAYRRAVIIAQFRAHPARVRCVHDDGNGRCRGGRDASGSDGSPRAQRSVVLGTASRASAKRRRSGHRALAQPVAFRPRGTR